MAHRKGPRDFHEPWVATRSRTWEAAFRSGPPTIGHAPEERAQAVADWEAARARAEKDADWIIWGSRLAEPIVCHNLDGSISVMDDRRILAVARKLGLPVDSPNHEEYARRIVACVNACAGIANPESFVAEARGLLKDLLLRRTDGEDGRILSLFARSIPPEELQIYVQEDAAAD